LAGWSVGYLVGWVGGIVLLFPVAYTLTNGLKSKENGNYGECETQLLKFPKNEISEQNYKRRTPICISGEW